mmetsp:Transcript_5274/g.11468  ORF Transcript_5274/g.11468 Transcript_5274/m.11468 type:complete len:227 (+) Transcript_5274:65-745(+)
MLINPQESSLNVSVRTSSIAAADSISSRKMCCSSTSNTSKKEGCKRTLKSTKSVSFSDEDEIRPVRRRTDIKNKEMQAVWYDEGDFDAIQKEAKRTVRAMRANATHNIDCTRGFENIRTQDVLIYTESQKAAAIQNVLKAHRNGASASELANVSLRHTQEAKARALVLGANDAYDVERFPDVVKEVDVPHVQVKKNNSKSKKSLFKRFAPKTKKEGSKNAVVGKAA